MTVEVSCDHIIALRDPATGTERLIQPNAKTYLPEREDPYEIRVDNNLVTHEAYPLRVTSYPKGQGGRVLSDHIKRNKNSKLRVTCKRNTYFLRFRGL